eukprot:TRINITY_DN10252_c0_g1_i1.p1 TRINITY_DN10252_c0_g1~~TRINITY_DN10252_c0_g1_i1.p1  ORF type:complete len:211 (-),score=24.38 TRINITY_DN10252_c0_g1_i1:94-702(-)
MNKLQLVFGAFCLLVFCGVVWADADAEYQLHGRYGHSMVMIKGDLYIYGGISEKKNQNNLVAQVVLNEVLRCTDMTETPCICELACNGTYKSDNKTLPKARAFHTAVVAEGTDSFFIFGGKDLEGNVLNDMWEFSMPGCQWKNHLRYVPEPVVFSEGSSTKTNRLDTVLWVFLSIGIALLLIISGVYCYREYKHRRSNATVI